MIVLFLCNTSVSVPSSCVFNVPGEQLDLTNVHRSAAGINYILYGNNVYIIQCNSEVIEHIRINPLLMYNVKMADKNVFFVRKSDRDLMRMSNEIIIPYQNNFITFKNKVARDTFLINFLKQYAKNDKYAHKYNLMEFVKFATTVYPQIGAVEDVPLTVVALIETYPVLKKVSIFKQIVENTDENLVLDNEFYANLNKKYASYGYRTVIKLLMLFGATKVSKQIRLNGDIVSRFNEIINGNVEVHEENELEESVDDDEEEESMILTAKTPLKAKQTKQIKQDSSEYDIDDNEQDEHSSEHDIDEDEESDGTAPPKIRQKVISSTPKKELKNKTKAGVYLLQRYADKDLSYVKIGKADDLVARLKKAPDYRNARIILTVGIKFENQKACEDAIMDAFKKEFVQVLESEFGTPGKETFEVNAENEVKAMDIFYEIAKQYK